MKISELVNGIYVADIIGKSAMGKTQPKSDKKTKKIVARAAALTEDLGQLYAEFHALIKRSDIDDETVHALLKKIEVEAKQRGQTAHSMIDDLMSPLTIEQLKRVIRMGTPTLKAAAREEFAHRNQ